MKKILIAFLICTTAKVASGSTSVVNPYYENVKDSIPATTDSSKFRMEDYVMMQAGKMLVIKKGKSQPLESDITMQDGSVVRIDGTLILKNGKTHVLREGDKVYMSGIVEAPKLQ